MVKERSPKDWGQGNKEQGSFQGGVASHRLPVRLKISYGLVIASPPWMLYIEPMQGR